MNTPLRIVFAGTPEFAACSLQALIDSPHDVIAVYTQPDRPAGRGRKLTASPVKQLAQQYEIPVYQPQSLKGEAEQAELASLQPDLMVVAAYGLILPKTVLDTPRLGCINVHASLLPAYRGAAPIHRAIMAGDTISGITIMQMDEGLDTGDMLLQMVCPIKPADTSGDLHDRLAQLGGQALIQALYSLHNCEVTPTPQNNAEASYAHKLTKEEGRIDWHQNAKQISRQIRGLHPWPIAFTQLAEQVIRIHAATIDSSQGSPGTPPGTILTTTKAGISVQCGDNTCLTLTRLQLPGGKPNNAQDMLNASNHIFQVGESFT